MNINLYRRLHKHIGTNWISEKNAVGVRQEFNQMLLIIGLAGGATSLLGLEGFPHINYDFWRWLFPGLETRIRMAAAPYTAFIMWTLSWLLFPYYVRRIVIAVPEIEHATMSPKQYTVRTLLTVIFALGMIYIFYFAGMSHDSFLSERSYGYDFYVKSKIGMGFTILSIAISTTLLVAFSILLVRHGAANWSKT